MSGYNVPDNNSPQPYQQPDSAYVEQVENWNRIEDGLNTIREVAGIHYEIKQQIENYPPQGTNQPR